MPAALFSLGSAREKEKERQGQIRITVLVCIRASTGHQRHSHYFYPFPFSYYWEKKNLLINEKLPLFFALFQSGNFFRMMVTQAGAAMKKDKPDGRQCAWSSCFTRPKENEVLARLKFLLARPGPDG